MRLFRRALIAVTFALAMFASFLLPPRPTIASDVWCWDDPAVLVDGVPIAINLGFRVRQLSAIQGVDITIEVPAGSSVRMLALEKATIIPTVRLISAPVTPLAGAPTGRRPGMFVKVTVMVRSHDSFDYGVNLLNAGYPSIAPQTLTAFTNQPYVGYIRLHAD